MFEFAGLKKKIGRNSHKKQANTAGPAPILQNKGYCPTCDQEVEFTAYQNWLRDHYLCSNCGSIPRERALMLTIDQYLPNWRNLTIHESSPNGRGASKRISEGCSHYIPSQYFPGEKAGSTVGQYRCENLEEMTFSDESIDLHVTQDVLEHVFHPAKVFKEIARTLRPGGMHRSTGQQGPAFKAQGTDRQW